MQKRHSYFPVIFALSAIQQAYFNFEICAWNTSLAVWAFVKKNTSNKSLAVNELKQLEIKQMKINL